MKKKHIQLSFLAIFLSLFFLNGCKNDITDNSSVIKAIAETSDRLVRAERAFDVNEILRYFAEDAIVQPSNAPQIQGKESIGKMYQQFFALEHLKEFHAIGSKIVTSESGDFAYQIGTNRTVFDIDNQSQVLNGHWMIIWEKIKDKWLVVLMTFSDNAS